MLVEDTESSRPSADDFYARPLTLVAGLGSEIAYVGRKGLNWRGRNAHVQKQCPGAHRLQPEEASRVDTGT